MEESFRLTLNAAASVLKAPEAQTGAKLDKVIFLFNFFDDRRRLAPGRERL